jgi:hypothetical protein
LYNDIDKEFGLSGFFYGRYEYDIIRTKIEDLIGTIITGL